MSVKRMVSDELGYYEWDTAYPLLTAIDSMNDFINHHLPDNCEIVETNGSRIVVDINGDKYEILADGRGDFFNHRVFMIKKNNDNGEGS